MFKRLSSATIKNHSEQPSEEDELDPTSRLDSTYLIVVQNFALKLLFSPKILYSNLHAKKETFREPIQSMK